MPTDVVIGDTVNQGSNFPAYTQSSSMTNGYEMPTPAHYANESARHPFQSQLDVEESAELENEPGNMQSWGEWDDDSSTQQSNNPDYVMTQNSRGNSD